MPLFFLDDFSLQCVFVWVTRSMLYPSKLVLEKYYILLLILIATHYKHTSIGKPKILNDM